MSLAFKRLVLLALEFLADHLHLHYKQHKATRMAALPAPAKPVKKRPSRRSSQVLDSTDKLIVQAEYKACCQDGNMTQQEFAELMNKTLKVNKSVRTYMRIVNKPPRSK